MTNENAVPNVIERQAAKRIAKAACTTVQDVNQVLKQYLQCTIDASVRRNGRAVPG